METLAELKERGHILSVVTNAGKRRVNAILAAKGTQDFFTVVICAEDVTNIKPAPDPVIKALEMLKKSSDTALLVGDSYAEVRAVKNAGVDTALLINQMQDTPLINGKPVNDKPTYYLKSFPELLEIIGSEETDK